MANNNSNEPEFLKDALKFGINLGLDRINSLLDKLGNPHKGLNVIHIAGTNGKGSTVAFLSSILAQNGSKVGIYTSPFLERFNERMRILNSASDLDAFIDDDSVGEIPNDKLVEYSDMVKKASQELIDGGMEPPTEFELVTAIAFLWFRDEKTDIVVLETGLGGRLDSTNVMDKPICTMITAMGMDHSDRLGDTIDKITAEKAGIIKPEVPALFLDPDVTLLLDSDEANLVRTTLVNRATELSAPYSFVKPDMKQQVFYSSEEGTMSFTYAGREYTTTLLGEHQIQNAAMAIECAQMMGIDSRIITLGISKARWKSRAEILSKKPLVIMDGGHNPQGILSFGKVLEGLGITGEGKVNVLIGAMKDKDMDSMLKLFKELLPNVQTFFVTKVNNPRTFEPDVLYNKIKFVYNRDDFSEDKVFEDAISATEEAWKYTQATDSSLVILGSLYLAGEIRGTIRELINAGR
ncbi:MAG: bifunctional folylpolyglutamate synthase/dihydrofolate synthase [Clostridia bacterium]|nr:bifunctional folylpolyglutamate synthase/dihydrofolate synthase [Clostridia bacterium]